jgi:hypothetical protein
VEKVVLFSQDRHIQVKLRKKAIKRNSEIIEILFIVVGARSNIGEVRKNFFSFQQIDQDRETRSISLAK